MARTNIIDTEKKTPAENARTFVVTLCIGFTVIMVICMALGSVFADEQAKQGINYCWSLFGACACASLLQFVFFTPVIIKRMSYPLRLLAFGICLYVVLAALAVAMSWFPANMAGAWVSFTISYLCALAIASAFFSVKQNRERKEFDDRLADYRRDNA